MKIYCSGIGGIGLSAYASLQNAAGHEILGSDRSDSELLNDLRSQGITVNLNQDGSNISEDIDLFVYSEAIPKDALERMAATKFDIPQKSYANALGDLSKDSFVIAVCGTHGKSSTVAMASKVLTECGIDPTVVVGTKLKEFDGKNWRHGDSNIFLLEACEYRRSFHNLSPDIILMTNVDGDHFDAFSDIDEYREAFNIFLKSLPEDGIVITHMEDLQCKKLVEGIDRKIIDADAYPLIDLSTPGRHMQENGQLVLALSDHLSINTTEYTSSLSGYSGCWRRMEQKGLINGSIPVIDDYGHHPKEVKATLDALKGSYPDNRIVCVFQPHTHERTLHFYDEFISSFKNADIVLLSSVYEARKDIERDVVDINDFASDICKTSNTICEVVGDLDSAYEHLNKDFLKEGDVLLCLGAGTITNLASRLVKERS
ncbi:UDP-N-acetylmuramate--L-alanine ligase [Candidatus Peregrinibacteria bacterium]|nr:UDP-N-acetylmuramate--L-alanine ligase [Candidatus Peregrinibacteria bacterium]MBT3598901.1 UDP-N-acetylmuramate--L-alanine ligase [Candidatus Peregrinibacteria bacterium]MBT4367316.1 UDP-N-acetylmuramate--L-alanine ligase [Candidatus Peregrinibacteria bacterium]MBT4585789.1 UDP-N-acetylmuramate--L-alanine ligase [Candidatus Peregrinibacteria bacterium]MBT6730702.1 UDP-N-acetylmuramate--L-alanine ligase [Candidatus Peregrinibacteria bacterium]